MPSVEFDVLTTGHWIRCPAWVPSTRPRAEAVLSGPGRSVCDVECNPLPLNLVRCNRRRVDLGAPVAYRRRSLVGVLKFDPRQPDELMTLYVGVRGSSPLSSTEIAGQARSKTGPDLFYCV